MDIKLIDVACRDALEHLFSLGTLCCDEMHLKGFVKDLPDPFLSIDCFSTEAVNVKSAGLLVDRVVDVTGNRPLCAEL